MPRSTKTKSDSLAHLSLRQITAVLRALQEQGITAHDLRRLRGNSDLAKRVAEVLKGVDPKRPPPSYDAIALFGFGPASPEPLPEAEAGGVVIRYGGWSLQQLRDSSVARAKNLVWEQDWYNKYAWSKEGVQPGIYWLRIPVQGTNQKSFAEQTPLLRVGEEPAPVCLVATALLAHLVETGESLLQDAWTRCREQGSFGNRVSIRIGGARLGVRYDYDDGRRDGLWLSSYRKLV